MNPRPMKRPPKTSCPYTGLVCRKCLQPVAVLSKHDATLLTMICPACRFSWSVAMADSVARVKD